MILIAKDENDKNTPEKDSYRLFNLSKPDRLGCKSTKPLLLIDEVNFSEESFITSSYYGNFILVDYGTWILIKFYVLKVQNQLIKKLKL